MSIHAHHKVRGLLEGQYGSVFKGRSMDFDDLREYIPGDDIKDIDWKATARSGQTRIKRYVAIRKHNILFVVDTGKNMAATASSGEPKRDIAVMATGILGHIAQKHGDLVALVAGNTAATQHMPLKGSSDHLERMLRHIDSESTLDAPSSNVGRQLEYIARSIRRRMMLVIVADDMAVSADDERLLRRLGAQHEIMWLTIGDIDITASEHEHSDVFDVESGHSLPPFVRSNKQLKTEFAAAAAARHADTKHMLDRLNIASERITAEADVLRGIYTLLERQRHAKR
ncbi:MAG: DUF58 domain-containing protein [Candidatus Saccharimonadales bacterium]